MKKYLGQQNVFKITKKERTLCINIKERLIKYASRMEGNIKYQHREHNAVIFMKLPGK